MKTTPDANVYAPLAVMRRDLPRGDKGGEKDVTVSLGNVVDSDADKGMEAHAPVDPDYVVQSYAVPAINCQEFVIYDRPLLALEAKPLAEALAAATGGDNGTRDISHVWRIPGTANWPNRKKVFERNRPREPQPVRIIKPWDGSLTSVAELRRVLANGGGQGRDEIGVLSHGDKPHARLDYETLIREGAPPGEDRSGLFHSVVWHLALRALSSDEIAAKLKEHPNGIAVKFIDRLDDEVRRSYKKWGACNGIKFDDFRAYMPTHTYIFTPSREMWTGASVNARLPRVPLLDNDGNPVLNKKDEPIEIYASEWIDKNRPVEMMTWCPGMPMLIRNRLVSDGGWIEHPGVSCFNLYRPPTISLGNAAKAGPWLEHVRKIFPDDAEHIIKWIAHRVQRPQDKINHALVLGGAMGIGKDAMLEPVKRSIGPWNFQEVSPQHMLGRFNGFLKSVILRISEARDLGDVDRFAFYDHMKAYTAAPPDVLRCDEKNLREHSVLNVCGVIITTNHKADGIFLPADNRRHFVAWSDLRKEDFPSDYWKRLWHYYENGGAEHVAAYLATLDISLFDSKAPPPKTSAFWEIVDASRAPEDAEMADALNALGYPSVLTLADILSRASAEFGEWLRDRKNARRIPHRLEECGYVVVRNDGSTDGRWKVHGQNRVIYGRSSLTKHARLAAAWRLTGAR